MRPKLKSPTNDLFLRFRSLYSCTFAGWRTGKQFDQLFSVSMQIAQPCPFLHILRLHLDGEKRTEKKIYEGKSYHFILGVLTRMEEKRNEQIKVTLIGENFSTQNWQEKDGNLLGTKKYF